VVDGGTLPVQTRGAQAIALLAGLLPTFDLEPGFTCV
jgi:hypothetical protein